MALGLVAGALGALAWVGIRSAPLRQGRSEGPPVVGTRLFENVLAYVRAHGVDSTPDQELYRLAAAGVIEELDDPYAALILPGQRVMSDPEEPAPQGLFLDRRDGLLVVVATATGSAAETAGIQGGDILLELDSIPLDATRLDRARRLLDGAPGTRITARVRRDGRGTPLQLEVARAEVPQTPAIEWSTRSGGIGQLKVRRFPMGVSDSIRAGVAALREAGARSLVLDLRGAVGGSLADGVAVADLFLDRGRTLAVSRGRPAAASTSFSDSTASPFDSIPVAVLVDRGTAGAAEVVAGALQDNDRAAVLGSITFGRGVTQSTFALGGGVTLRLTTALWITPSGRQIQRPPTPADRDSVPRPRLKSKGGRVLLGGGGIVPDRLLLNSGSHDDLLAEAQRILRKAGTTREVLALVANR